METKTIDLQSLGLINLHSGSCWESNPSQNIHLPICSISHCCRMLIPSPAPFVPSTETPVILHLPAQLATPRLLLPYWFSQGITAYNLLFLSNLRFQLMVTGKELNVACSFLYQCFILFFCMSTLMWSLAFKFMFSKMKKISQIRFYLMIISMMW